MDANLECDPAALTLDGRLAALVEAERAIAHLQARQARLIAAIADDPCADAVAPRLDRDWAKEELRAALGESAESVNNRIELARALLHRLPTTLAALESGRITLRHARLLADGIVSLGDDAAARVEAAALEFGAGGDLSAFARKVRREVLKCDNRSLEDQVADALADRRVWSRPGEHAMSVFGAILPPEGAQVLMTALNMLADQCPADDPRSRDQRRADALVQLGIDAVNGYARCPTCVVRDDTPQAGTGPRWLGLRPTIQVSVALSTLLGLDEQPGELAGYGPIPAHVARRLAADQTGTWRRLVTDELGRLRDYGRTRYRPPADLHDFVVARDQTCAFPPATGRRPAANWTTSIPGATAARRTPTTSSPCAGDTTTPNTTPVGNCVGWPTAAWNGQARPGGSMSSRCPPIRSTRRTACTSRTTTPNITRRTTTHHPRTWRHNRAA